MQEKTAFCRFVRIAFSFFLLFYSCRPYDYGDAKWVCEEYGAWFTVEEEENYQSYGEVVVDGKVQKIAILFAPGSFVVILPRDAVENMSPIETDLSLIHI